MGQFKIYFGSNRIIINFFKRHLLYVYVPIYPINNHVTRFSLVQK